MVRLFACTLGFLVIGCQAPAGRFCEHPQFDAAAEALAGDRAAPAVEGRFGGVVSDAAAERRLETIARRVAAASPELGGQRRCCCKLLASAQPNAVSLPGGRIYLTQGLYARLDADDLVAAVIAHEMAHAAARDHFKPRCGDPEAALERELSADARAVAYLRAAGYAPSAMARLNQLIADVQPADWAARRTACVHRLVSAGSSRL